VHLPRFGDNRYAYTVVVGKPEGKKLLGKPRRRWQDNVKNYLRDIGSELGPEAGSCEHNNETLASVIFCCVLE
jgi:hypothetical protein